MTTVIELPKKTRSEIKALPDHVVDRLVAYKTENRLTDAELAQKIGCNSTQINRAINRNFIGDESAFIDKVEDFFKNEPERRERVGKLFPNVFYRNLTAFFEQVRRTLDIGVAWSAAGKGKSACSELYAQSTPLTTLVTVRKWAAGSRGIMQAIWAQVDTSSWRKDMSRSDFLVQRFCKSPRLIIVDNANRLTRGGWQWIIDFADETGSPLALVAHKDVLESIKSDDQLYSRIGSFQEIKGGNIESDARKLTEIFWPDAVGKLDGLDIQVLKQPGHMRALKKQLLFAREMADDFATPAEAFRAAHTKLIRNYRLEEE